MQYITPHLTTLLLVLVLLTADSLAALAQPWIAGKLASALAGQNPVNRPASIALANRVVKMQDARVLPGAYF